MSWNAIPRYRPNLPSYGVSVALHRNGILNVLISHDLCWALKWKAGARVAVYIGADQHEGKMRLDPDEKGRKLHAKKNAAGMVLHVSESLLPPDWYRGHLPALSCQYEIDDGGLVVSLPRALWRPVTHRLSAVSTGG